MATEGSSSSCSEDVTSWIRSIVDYVKNTQASCLDLRTLPVDFFETVGANIQTVLESLPDSTIREVRLKSDGRKDKIQDWSRVLIGSKIEKLDLGRCELNMDDILSLTAVLKDTRVKELDISGCYKFKSNNDKVEELFTHLAKSPLRSLRLFGARFLPVEDISVFSRRLAKTQIACLNLTRAFSFDKYLSSDDRAELLYTLMSNLPTTLTDLTLGQNDLDNASITVIGRCLENSKLEKLSLSFNRIGDYGIDFFVAGLVQSKISYLDLSHNKINGDNALCDSLKATKITELNLSGNPLTNGRFISNPKFLQGSAVVVLKLAGGRSKYDKYNRAPLPIREFISSKLTCLDLSFGKISLDYISGLAAVLSHSNITHIFLNGNFLSAECYNILGDCLSGSVLKYINLNGTTNSHESKRGMAYFLDKTKGSALVSVTLRSNGICEAIDIIAPALANTTLFELDLAENFKLDNSIASLAAQLQWSAITDLCLSYNDIGNEDAAALAEYLDKTQIVILDLSVNSIANYGAIALSLAFKKTKLRHLNLRCNKIGDDGLESLAENVKNSCITYLNLEHNRGERKRRLLVDQALWENRKKVQQFADLLKKKSFFIDESDLFQLDRDLDLMDMNMDVLIEDFLKLYKMVSDEPCIVSVIAQDKCILDLQKQDFFNEYNVFIEDCENVYKKIVEHPSPIQNTTGRNDRVSFFKNQFLWIILEELPRKFVSFIGRNMEADVDEHVSLLRKIEELGHTGIVDLLLLNRPVYMIDEEQDILHPYVYLLLSKYKQTICNAEIEPEGVKKIVKYFTDHIDMDGASEIIALLDNGESSLSVSNNE